MSELHRLTALEQLHLLRSGEVKPSELVECYLDRIERLNPELGAFTVVTADAARQRAAQLEASGSRASALWGLASGEKDLWARTGVRTAYGSRAFADFVPEMSDEIADVLDAAGAISLGKTATPEFGLPAYTEPLSDAPAVNPWDTSLGSGGSSGGSCHSRPARTVVARFASPPPRPDSSVSSLRAVACPPVLVSVVSASFP